MKRKLVLSLSLFSALSSGSVLADHYCHDYLKTKMQDRRIFFSTITAPTVFVPIAINKTRYDDHKRNIGYYKEASKYYKCTDHKYSKDMRKLYSKFKKMNPSSTVCFKDFVEAIAVADKNPSTMTGRKFCKYTHKKSTFLKALFPKGCIHPDLMKLIIADRGPQPVKCDKDQVKDVGPCQDQVQAPYQDQVQVPCQDQVQAPCQDQVQAPCQDQVQAPYQDQVDQISKV